ncbi:hypothetical protein EUTSA_v10020512mg [Eutrema salsugineum]|uniref:C3H1-type domain-containing protein n=2 Tax=Eutrema salsugineum TaxID=72664 RepID=V4LC93_EUTSA|nr:hypothetical protein EUTSA_v10020512mg [Eutrema salsugineum]
MTYQADDFRENAMMKGARSSGYDTDFPEDSSRREHLHDGVSDPRLRRHRSELTGEKETQRRDVVDGEGVFHRSSNIPCKFFAAGFCRNGKHCRFSHHGGDRKQPQESNFYREDNRNHSRWNDVERLNNGKLGGIEVSRASKGISEAKGNGSSWIDGMEMSPDWNYGVKNPMKKEESGVGIIGQSSQSRDLKDDQRSSDVFSYGDKPMVEKPVNMAAPPVQAFSQNHNVLPYQNSQTAGGSQQVIAAAAADFSLGSNLSNPESRMVYEDNHHSTVEKPVPVQNDVTREQMDKISNISASIAQFFANGQPIPQQLTQVLQMPLHSESSMAVQPNLATTTQSNSVSNNPNLLWGLGMSTGPQGVSTVAASQVNDVDGTRELALNPKASEENGEKKTDEASKEGEGKKTGEDTKDAENVVDEDEDDGDGSDEEDKKGKDPKGMRAFKFALVEIVKELLKPAWKEGKMNKDGYKNIVKKVVEKVTGTMQSGNVPQTQEKIDHYLSASKPKLTKLVQAYISKFKKAD